MLGKKKRSRARCQNNRVKKKENLRKGRGKRVEINKIIRFFVAGEKLGLRRHLRCMLHPDS